MSCVNVTVQSLDGSIFACEMQSTDMVGKFREQLSEKLGLDSDSFRLLAGPSILDDNKDFTEYMLDGVKDVQLQLVKFDPLPGLGRFDASGQRGIDVVFVPLDTTGKCTTKTCHIAKTSSSPDSNNVFLQHHIREPCFVEFRIIRSRDEISLGVTYDEKVASISGFANLYTDTTWIYSKVKSMPTFFFAGKKVNPEGARGVEQGDCITVYTNPQERLVKFYKNGSLVGSNLPDFPLPAENELPLRMYVMLDDVHDEVEIVRFGPGEP